MEARTTRAATLLAAGLAVGAAVVVLAIPGNDADPSASQSPPSILSVSCAPEGIKVSDHELVAGPSGPRFEVSSSLPAGAYLTVTNPDGSGGGSPLPRTTKVWTLAVAPGAVTIACQPRGADSAARDTARITIADPDRFWQDTTLDDLNCPGRDEPYLDSTSGQTPQEAVDALMATFEGSRRDYAARNAHMGYVEAASQTWLVYRNRVPYLSVSLRPDHTGYAAYPGFIC